MKKRMSVLWILIWASLCFAVPAHAANENNAAVKAAADRFYAALNAMFTGETAPMADVWAHTDDVTYMGPDGVFVVGWDDVMAVWEKQASKKMGGQVRPDKMQIMSGSDMGVTYNYEIGENTDEDGNPVSVSIRATNIFRKDAAGEWKMVGHQTDLLPFLEEDNA